MRHQRREDDRVKWVTEKSSCVCVYTHHTHEGLFRWWLKRGEIDVLTSRGFPLHRTHSADNGVAEFFWFSFRFKYKKLGRHCSMFVCAGERKERWGKSLTFSSPFFLPVVSRPSSRRHFPPPVKTNTTRDPPFRPRRSNSLKAGVNLVEVYWEEEEEKKLNVPNVQHFFFLPLLSPWMQLNRMWGMWERLLRSRFVKTIWTNSFLPPPSSCVEWREEEKK